MSHPSRLALDLLSVGDLLPSDRDVVRAHIDGCAECRAYLDDLEREKRDRLEAVPPTAFVQKLLAREAEGDLDRRDRRSAVPSRRATWRSPTRRWAPRAAIGAVGVVLAAAAMWLLVPRGVIPSDEVRVKGNGLTLYRKRGEQTEVLSEADPIRAGDALRLVITLDHAAPVDVWFVDATGRVDRYLPEPARLLPGANALADSAVVDAPCSDLWLVVAVGEATIAQAEERLRGPERIWPGDPATLPPAVILRKLVCEADEGQGGAP